MQEDTKIDESIQKGSDEKPRKPRGFAAISPERRKEISSKGGQSAHAAGTAHQFTQEEARAAGRKGGLAPHRSRGKRSAGAPPVG